MLKMLMGTPRMLVRPVGLRAVVVAVLGMCAAACGGLEAGAPVATGLDEPGATLQAVTAVPAGALCLRLSVVGPRTVRKVFPVTAASSTALLDMGRLVAGTYQLSGEAYDVACPATGTTVGNDPTWLAEAVALEVQVGVPAQGTLSFRRVTSTSVAADFVRRAVQVVLAGEGRYALLDDGTVWGWGNNQYGFLGTGTSGIVRKPVRLDLPPRVVHLSAGLSGACALTAPEGALYCWGSSPAFSTSTGNYFTEDTVRFTTPTQVVASGVEQVSVGADHVCYFATGSPWLWCNGSQGNPSRGFHGGTYVGEYAATGGQLVSSRDESARLDQTGAALTWGYPFNSFDTGAERYAELYANGASETICAVETDGTVVCKGVSLPGDGSLTSYPTVTRVDALFNFRQLSFEYRGGCGIATRANGALACWGEPGLPGQRGRPMYMGIEGAVDVAVTIGGACAVTRDGVVYCWGVGPVGDGGERYEAMPVRVRF